MLLQPCSKDKKKKKTEKENKKNPMKTLIVH